MSDLISRLKLIEYLESRTGEFTDDVGKAWNSGIETAIRAVEKFPSVEPKNEWISVKDRLPEDFVPVLIHIPNQNPMPTVREGYYAKRVWMCQSLFGLLEPRYDTVTHWMTMAEPPKGEEHG